MFTIQKKHCVLNLSILNYLYIPNNKFLQLTDAIYSSNCLHIAHQIVRKNIGQNFEPTKNINDGVCWYVV